MASIGFIGLGAMGGGMAQVLLKRGFDVTGYDIHEPFVNKFVEAGGKGAKSPKEAASKADFVISMVQNALQNSKILFEGEHAAVHGLGNGDTFILCSTVPTSFPQEVRTRLDEEFGRPDIKFLDCPVSGGTFRAADGTLSIFSSGPEKDLDAAKDILECVSANLYRMGEIGNGTKTKMAHQILVATNIIASAEIMGLAATVGLNTKTVMEYVNNSEGASFMFQNRVPHMVENDFSALSALTLILKDTTILTDAARAAQFPAPLSNMAHSLYLKGASEGMSKDHDARLVQLYLPKGQGDLVSQKTTADVKMTSTNQISKDTLVDLLCGIHLAGAIEAMGFNKALCQDRKQMCEIILKAAGWSRMFEKHIPPMLEKDSWTLADCPEAAEIGRRLSDAVDKCVKIRYPCPTAATALQQYNFALLGK